MLYLILAITSSCLVSVCMRISKDHTKNEVSLLLYNYLICTALSFVYTGIPSMHSNDPSFCVCLGLGLISGFLYLMGFVSLKKSLHENGVILSAFFQRLGILIPTLLTIFVFKEVPTSFQVMGMILAFICIMVLQTGKSDSLMNSPVWLLLLLISNGMADAMAKIFERVGNTNYQNEFLSLTFLFAFIMCFVLVLSKKEKPNRNDIVFGCIIGIPNYYSARFLLKSLYSLPAIYVYPINSIMVILIVSMIGFIFFKEKITKKQCISFMGILISLFLLN